RAKYRPDVRGVYAKNTPGRMETIFYSSTPRQFVSMSNGTDGVDHLRRHGKAERYGLARASKLERLQHDLHLGLGTGLQLGERHDAAHEVAGVVGGLFVARRGANDAANPAVDVARDREPRNRRNLAGHRLGQIGLRAQRIEASHRPRVARIEG